MIIDSGVVTGSLQVSGSLTVTGSSDLQGPVTISGSLNVNGPISGAITGSVTSASYATFAENAGTASYVANAVSASRATSAANADTASYVLQATSASLATTNLYTASVSNNVVTFTKGDTTTFNLTVATGSGTSTVSSSFATSASFAQTASFIQDAVSASRATSAASADTAANATLFNSLSSSQFPQLVIDNTFTGNNVFGNITGSNAKFNTASIEYLNVIYQTSSIVYSSGSNQLGDASGDVQTLWGTVDVKTGPLLVTGSVRATNLTGSLNGSNLIAGSVANDRLTNSAVTFNGSAVSLGGSATITANTTNTLTIGTGLSGTSFNGSAAVTIANTGVTSNVASTGISVSGATGAVTITNTGVTSAVAGTAISVSGATGAVTITNTGVTSNVAGTGVTVSGATGAVTISIGQAVATSSNVQFNSLGVGTAGSATAGEIRATNDITAFYSSDERLKENITSIENPIEKLMAINGVTFDWKEGFDEIHSHKGADTGVIAQQIEAIGLPETVTTRENGFKAVKYEKLNALLIEGFKAQQREIDKLKALVNTLLNK